MSSSRSNILGPLAEVTVEKMFVPAQEIPSTSKEITKFIEKLDHSNIFPPNHSAHEIMVKDLNKEGLPKRSMNCFFCFRHVVYREVVLQKRLEAVKDGVFFTRVVSEMWSNASEKNRDDYKELATKLKQLQTDFHKDKNYNKSKPAGSVFVSMNDLHNKSRKRKKNTVKMTDKIPAKRLKKYENSSQSQQAVQKNIIANQNIQEVPCYFDSLMDTQQSFEVYDSFPYQISCDSYSTQYIYPDSTLDSTCNSWIHQLTFQ